MWWTQLTLNTDPTRPGQPHLRTFISIFFLTSQASAFLSPRKRKEDNKKKMSATETAETAATSPSPNPNPAKDGEILDAEVESYAPCFQCCVCL